MTDKKFSFLVILNIVALILATIAITFSLKDNNKEYVVTPVVNQDFERDAKLASIPSKDGELIPSLAPILKGKKDSIVNISTKGTVEVKNSPFSRSPFFNDPFFERFFKFNAPQLPHQRETQSIGSGVIVDSKNGYILTNHHVIDNADEIYVTLLDKRRLEAKLIGSDAETDIAVLQVDSKQLTAINIGTSSNLEVGDFVVAIGNPFGLGHTVTSGIVSALERSGIGIVDGYENFIQTDASINPGNSGGALINLKGDLIGINTAIISRGGGNVGIGFAIPIDMAQGVMKQLIEHGEVKRGQLGIQIQDITPDIVEAMDLDINEGTIIANVVEGSPAQDSGIQTGDIVTHLNGKKVRSAADLKNKVGGLRVGDEVKLQILREGKTKTITTKIGTRSKVASKDGSVKSIDVDLLKGAEFKDAKKGVQVVGVEQGSPAARAGLREGDIILSVNQQEVNTTDELFKAAKKQKKGILINLKRGNASMFIVIN